MIRGVIIVNNHGKPRLVKFYQTVVGGQGISFTKSIFGGVEKGAISCCCVSALFSVLEALQGYYALNCGIPDV